MATSTTPTVQHHSSLQLEASSQNRPLHVTNEAIEIQEPIQHIGDVGCKRVLNEPVHC